MWLPGMNYGNTFLILMPMSHQILSISGSPAYGENKAAGGHDPIETKRGVAIVFALPKVLKGRIVAEVYPDKFVDPGNPRYLSGGDSGFGRHGGHVLWPGRARGYAPIDTTLKAQARSTPGRLLRNYARSQMTRGMISPDFAEEEVSRFLLLTAAVVARYFTRSADFLKKM